MTSRGRKEGTMSTTDLSTTLDGLAAKIEHHHRAARRALEEAVSHAIEAGDALAEAKALLRHGEWGAWVDEHFSGSRRTAQLYVRFARHREYAQAIAHLGVAGVDRAISMRGRLTDPIGLAWELPYLPPDDQRVIKRALGEALTTGERASVALNVAGARAAMEPGAAARAAESTVRSAVADDVHRFLLAVNRLGRRPAHRVLDGFSEEMARRADERGRASLLHHVRHARLLLESVERRLDASDGDTP